jgi:hypothetical protein
MLLVFAARAVCTRAQRIFVPATGMRTTTQRYLETTFSVQIVFVVSAPLLPTAVRTGFVPYRSIACGRKTLCCAVAAHTAGLATAWLR